MSEGGSTDGITVVLVVVMPTMLAIILVIVLGIAIAFFLWQRFKSRGKPEEGKYVYYSSLSVTMLLTGFHVRPPKRARKKQTL